MQNLLIPEDRWVELFLNDRTIHFYATTHYMIEPYDERQLQPASYDLLLGGAERSLPTFLNPGEFILATTLERVNIPNNIVGRLEGKSTWARRGVIIHTAGFIDPGFRGQLTLEITNLGQNLIQLNENDPICQISFAFLNAPAVKPYGHPFLGSHYQDQEGATPSYNDHVK